MCEVNCNAEIFPGEQRRENQAAWTQCFMFAFCSVPFLPLIARSLSVALSTPVPYPRTTPLKPTDEWRERNVTDLTMLLLPPPMALPRASHTSTPLLRAQPLLSMSATLSFIPHTSAVLTLATEPNVKAP